MIDIMLMRVAKILTFAGNQPLTNASGFFYLHEEFLYLVAARHVVIDEVAGHRPDRLRVKSLLYRMVTMKGDQTDHDQVIGADRPRPVSSRRALACNVESGGTAARRFCRIPLGQWKWKTPTC